MKKSRCKLSRKVVRKPLSQVTPKRPRSKAKRVHIDDGRCWCGAFHISAEWFKKNAVLTPVKDVRTWIVAWRIGRNGIAHRAVCNKVDADMLYDCLRRLAFKAGVRVYRPIQDK